MRSPQNLRGGGHPLPLPHPFISPFLSLSKAQPPCPWASEGTLPDPQRLWGLATLSLILTDAGKWA